MLYKLKVRFLKTWRGNWLWRYWRAEITDEFEPSQGYGNRFWGLTPSCLASLLETAGFRIDYRDNEAFAQTFICSPVDVPFAHHLPGDAEARQMGSAISTAGAARPA